MLPRLFKEGDVGLLGRLHACLVQSCNPHTDFLYAYAKQHLQQLSTAPIQPFLQLLLGLNEQVWIAAYARLTIQYFKNIKGNSTTLVMQALEPHNEALFACIVPSAITCFSVRHYMLERLWENGEGDITDDDEEDEDGEVIGIANIARLAVFEQLAPRNLLQVCLKMIHNNTGSRADVEWFRKQLALSWSPSRHVRWNRAHHQLVMSVLLCAQRFQFQLPEELWLDHILPNV